MFGIKTCGPARVLESKGWDTGTAPGCSGRLDSRHSRGAGGRRRRMRRRRGHPVSRLDPNAQHVPVPGPAGPAEPAAPPAADGCRQCGGSSESKPEACLAETSSYPPGRRCPGPGLRLAVSRVPVRTAAVLGDRFPDRRGRREHVRMARSSGVTGRFRVRLKPQADPRRSQAGVWCLVPSCDRPEQHPGPGDSDIKLRRGEQLNWPEPEPGRRPSPVSGSQLPPPPRATPLVRRLGSSS